MPTKHTYDLVLGDRFCFVPDGARDRSVWVTLLQIAVNAPGTGRMTAALEVITDEGDEMQCTMPLGASVEVENFPRGTQRALEDLIQAATRALQIDPTHAFWRTCLLQIIREAHARRVYADPPTRICPECHLDAREHAPHCSSYAPLGIDP